MHNQVDIFRKKEYIRWFLNAYKLKKEEMEKVLIYLLHNPELLEKIHFVEDIRNLSNALLISANDAQTISFILRIDNVYYYEVDEFLDQLSKYPPEKLHVWLSFNRDYMCSLCKEILVSSPKTKKQALHQKIIEDLELEINKKIYADQIRRTELLMQIDYAIENNDQETFFKLSSELKKLAS